MHSAPHLTPSLHRSLAHSLAHSPSSWLCCQGYRTASCGIYLNDAAACGSLSLSLSLPPSYSLPLSLSLSLLQDTNKREARRLPDLYLSHTRRHIQIPCLANTLIFILSFLPRTEVRRRGAGVVPGVWLLVFRLREEQRAVAADGDVKTG